MRFCFCYISTYCLFLTIVFFPKEEYGINVLSNPCFVLVAVFELAVTAMAVAEGFVLEVLYLNTL